MSPDLASPPPLSPLRLLDPDRLRHVDGPAWEGDPAPGRLPVPGSQVLAQTLWIAGRSQAPRLPHSVHARFLRPGRSGLSIRYEAEMLRSGRTLTTLRFHVSQAGALLATVDYSLFEPGAEEAEAEWEAQAEGPALRAAGPLPVEASTVSSMPPMAAFETRAEGDAALGGSAIHPFWIRHADRLDDEPLVHLALLAWLSDVGVSGSVFPPGTAMARRREGTSLDLAAWFHRPGRIDEWLYVHAESLIAVHGRGTATGAMFDRSGRRILTFAQEALFRSARPVSPSPLRG